MSIYSDVILDRLDPRNRHYYWMVGVPKGSKTFPAATVFTLIKGI